MVSFAAGVLTGVAAVASPVDTLGEDSSQMMHMVQHVLIGDLAPLLLVLGLTRPVLRSLIAHHGVRPLRALAHPLVALPLWAVNLYVWHVPVMYEAALRHDVIHALEHGTFLVFGVGLWAAVLEPLPGPIWFGDVSKIFYLLIAQAASGLLATVLIFGQGVLYASYRHAPRLWDMSPEHSQVLAGLVLLAQGTAITLAVSAVLLHRACEEDRGQLALSDLGVDERRAARAARFANTEPLRRSIDPTAR